MACVFKMKAACTHSHEEGFGKDEAAGYLLKLLREK
jgi:hypothetical protein